MLLALLVFSCTTEPKAPVAPVVVDHGDDARLVEKPDFLTFYPEWTGLGTGKKWTLEGATARIATPDLTVSLDFFAPEMFRYRLGEGSAMVLPQGMKLTAAETSGGVTFDTGALQVFVDFAGLGVRVQRDGQGVFEDVKPPQRVKGRWVFFKNLAPEDRFFGLGDRETGLQLNGQYLRNWASEEFRALSGFFLNHNPGRTYGVWVPHPGQAFFNFGEAQKDQLFFGAVGGVPEYYFLGQKAPGDVLRGLGTLVSGRSLPPLWALGLQAPVPSGLAPDQVGPWVEALRKAGIPVDALGTDGAAAPDLIRYLTQKEMGYWQTWGPAVPGAAETDGTGTFLRDTRGAPVAGAAGALWLDPLEPGTQAWLKASALGTLAGDRAGVMVQGVWPRTAGGLGGSLPWETLVTTGAGGNLVSRSYHQYAAGLAQAVVQGVQGPQEKRRRYFSADGGFLASGASWALNLKARGTGWAQLKESLVQGQALSVSGFPGFGLSFGAPDSPELEVRQAQVATLWPLVRTPAPQTQDQAPGTLAAVKKALEQRYTLLPYYYTLSWLNLKRGEAWVRPLFYDFPKDTNAKDKLDQVMLGPGLLAAPVLEAGATTREVYFPRGSLWFDMETGKEYGPGRTEKIKVGLGSLPMFVRAGSLIPTQDSALTTHEMRDRPITIHVWPGANGRQTFYFDDGVTQGYQQGEYLELESAFGNDQDYMQIQQRVLHRPQTWSLGFDSLLYRFHLVRPPKNVFVNGKAIPLKGDSYGVTDADRATAWYENDNTLLIKVFSPQLDQDIQIYY